MDACIERRPVLSLCIEDVDGGEVEGRRVYKLTVGRPAGRELAIRAGKSAYPMTGEIEDMYLAVATQDSPSGKGNLVPVPKSLAYSSAQSAENIGSLDVKRAGDARRTENLSTCRLHDHVDHANDHLAL